MTTAHTPGPWRARRADAYETNITATATGCNIADTWNSTSKVGNGYPSAAEADANAALIAAAPDLLEALRKFHAWAKCDDALPPITIDDAMAYASAAIAKAEGRAHP